MAYSLLKGNMSVDERPRGSARLTQPGIACGL